MLDNQKQKSILDLAKWVYTDAKQFEEKVSKLKSLIDGLENVSESADTTSTQVSRPPSYTTAASDDMPPPYTTSESRRTRAPRINTDLQSTPSRPMSVFSPLYAGEFSKHYIAFKHLLAASHSPDQPRVDSRARDKLSRLSDIQFMELRIDTYDELLRRQKYNDSRRYLAENQLYHPKRNLARRKLASLPDNRFLDLVVDVAGEIERRLGPGAELRSSTGLHFWIPELGNSPNTSPTSTTSTTSPVTPNQHLSLFSTTPLPSIPNQTYSPISPPPFSISSPTNSETTFQSFRVSPSSTTSTLLSAAMQKYGIQASWRDYSLWIMYGPENMQELCLGLEETPLSVFRRLEREGRKPMFMLRKNA